VSRTARVLRIGVAVAAIAAGSAHFAYWYLPRERPGRPGAAAAEALRAPAGPGEVTVWIPYPHQNLGRLESSVGDLRAWVAALGGLEDVPRRTFPGFAGFAVPPADELWLRADRCGGVRAELRAYPLVSLLARAAGAVAGNPWLAGGDVGGRGGGRGRALWQGRTWTLELDGRTGGGCPAATPPAPAAAPAAAPALARFRLGSAAGPLPAGPYRVVRGPEGLEVQSDRAGAATAALLEPPPAPNAEDPAGWLVEVDAQGGLRAIAVWEGAGSVAGLPAIAVLERGRRGFGLPGEELLRWAGERVPEADVEGLRVSALDRDTLERGRRFAGELLRWLEERPGRPLTLAAADPSRLAPLASGIATVLERVPILGAARARPFATAAALAAPLGDCRASGLEAVGEPPEVRLLVCRRTVLERGRSR
jgi:hypothetical protein